MNFLEAWLRTPLAAAAGWTLLHSLWEGAVVAAALAAVLLALRSPRARYAAACLSLLVLLGGVVFTLIRLLPASTPLPRTVIPPAFPAWSVPAGLSASSSWTSGLAFLVPWLASFWVAGVAVFFVWHIVAWTSARRLRHWGVCCAPEPWSNQLSYLAARISVTRPVLLLESCFADAPMVLGHFRPLILMPVGLLAGLPPGQVEAILLHELAHIRRYDYLVNILQRSVEDLLFYHPAVWWISRVIRAERENCCDDVVVSTRGNAQEYATALATLEYNRCSAREPAVAATGGSLVNESVVCSIRRGRSAHGRRYSPRPFFLQPRL
ncbi:MAG TPA: M56 family metallopeptidase [Bryobacteraceae bacterium]|nr:M56 family metallopeptidase [Bryobacteraceae bacterium]